MRHGTRMEVVLEAILDTGFETTVDLSSSVVWELDDEVTRQQLARVINIGLATCGWVLLAGDTRSAAIPIAGPRRRMERVSLPDQPTRLARGSIMELAFDDTTERVVVRDIHWERVDGRRRLIDAQVLRLPSDGIVRPMDLESLA